MFDSEFLLSELDSSNGGDGSSGFILQGDEADNSGISVSGAGDVNGDGIDDLIVGASGIYDPNSEDNPTGKSYVVFGKSDFEAEINLASLADGDGNAGFAIEGIDPGDFAGYSVSNAGDINNDGIDDLIIGARSADGENNDSQSRGESYVVYGSDNFGSSISLSAIANGDGADGLVIYGAGDGDIFGTSVSSAGDVNHDGIDDIIIGASFTDPNNAEDAGTSYVIYGSETLGKVIDLSQPLSIDGSNGFSINGADEYDIFGTSVSSAGDVNNDGIDDLIVGASGGSGNDNDLFVSGESYLIFGGSAIGAEVNLADLIGGDGSIGSVIYGVEDFDAAGTSVSGAGDVNGDGIDDVIIGAELAGGKNNATDSSGESYVVYGSSNLAAQINLSATVDSNGSNGSNGFAIYGIDESDLSGTSVSEAGDLNGDGIDDVIIGARGADGKQNAGNNVGESYVIFGKDTANASVDLEALKNSDGKDGFVIYGINSGDSLGTSVSSAGDINGDGIDDVIVGANTADNGSSSDSGASYVIFGRAQPNTITAAVPSDDNNFKGTDANDTLIGGAGNDTLSGKDGNDRLDGNNGNDKLSGHFGQDLLKGGDGDDLLIGCQGSDTVIGDRGEDTLRGNANNDTLLGGANRDILNGGAGDDLIDGGSGEDKMYGGTGKDVFVLRSGDVGNTIYDFTDNSDLIRLQAGLKFADLTITNNVGNSNTSIIDNSNRVLVTLVDVNAADISKTDFI
ncbi:MAG: hypothetical protein AAFY63_10945 [Cyanobacteria bacterium J06643_13]